MINTLHIQIEEETQAFEEQKEKDRRRLAEKQNMAAVRIQAGFRAYLVHKEYAPILMDWRADLKRKRELQEAVEREQKEKEERLKRRALELKQQQERERKSQEAKERQELAERMKRREEYEKKKEIVRLLRQEQLILEELKQEEESKLVREKNVGPANMHQEIKSVMDVQETEKREEEADETKSLQSKVESENTDKDAANKGTEIEKMEQEKDKTGNIQRTSSENTENCFVIATKEEVTKQGKEQEMESRTENPKLVLEKEQKEETQDGKCHGAIHEKLQCENGVSEGGILKSEEEEQLNVKHSEASIENEPPYVGDHCSTAVDFQKTRNTGVPSPEMISVVKEENSIFTNGSNMNVQLDSGDAGRTDKTFENRFLVSEVPEKTSDQLHSDGNAVTCFEQQPELADTIEEKRLAWMKTCKSWSRIYRENQKKKVVEKSRLRKCSAGLMPPLSAATMIQAGPWNALEQVSTSWNGVPVSFVSVMQAKTYLRLHSRAE